MVEPVLGVPRKKTLGMKRVEMNTTLLLVTELKNIVQEFGAEIHTSKGGMNGQIIKISIRPIFGMK